MTVVSRRGRTTYPSLRAMERGSRLADLFEFRREIRIANSIAWCETLSSVRGRESFIVQ